MATDTKVEEHKDLKVSDRHQAIVDKITVEFNEVLKNLSLPGMFPYAYKCTTELAYKLPDESTLVLEVNDEWLEDEAKLICYLRETIAANLVHFGIPSSVANLHMVKLIAEQEEEKRKQSGEGKVETMTCKVGEAEIVLPIPEKVSPFHDYLGAAIVQSKAKMEIEQPTGDPVNHPPHYNQGKYGVMDVIEDWKLNHHLATAVAYIARAEHKGNLVQDLQKAIWYLNRYIELISKVEKGSG